MKTIYVLIDNRSIFCMVYYESVGDNLLHVVMKCDKRSTDHFVNWRFHWTLTFVI